MNGPDDYLNEIQAEEIYQGDYYDTIPFGDAVRFEDEAVARDLALGEGEPDFDPEEEAVAEAEASQFDDETF